ncbi:protein KASH5 isoform X2 [Rhinoderma darwinii]|uniref:protein KASH5 isoform X2 n=1 Tax=Rhinoderma darwinii TaxID=43563 RepID=UPI003F675224
MSIGILDEYQYWSTDESSEQDLEPINEDASQKYLEQTANLSSEEQILDSVFRVCDVEERGVVPAFQILDYLKSVTDPSRDGKRLQCLSNMLDPDGQSILIDLLTFRKAMSKWIESCWMDRDVSGTTEDEIRLKDLQPSTESKSTAQLEEYGGYFNRHMGEHTNQSIKIAELNCANKKLIDQKIKLQRSLDLAEETNTLLTEEISDLKIKLKSSQQARQDARSICNELEDTKIFVKNLEDKISVVITEKKQLEKDERLLSSQKQSLHEENDKLLSENENIKEKLDGLRAENSKLLNQLYEYENLLVQKDELLTQKTIQLGEVMEIAEEQKTLLQELKNEKNNLQEELLQTHEAIAIHSSLSHKQCSSSLSVWSVRNEIQETQESNLNHQLELLDPLYHISECSLEVEKAVEDIWIDTETELIQLKQGVDILMINLHQITLSWQQVAYETSFTPLSCIMAICNVFEQQMKGVVQIYREIRSTGHPQLHYTKNTLKEQSTFLLQSLSYLTHLKCAWETYASMLNGAKQINTNKLALSPRTRFPTDWSLLPVNNQLIVHQRVQDTISAGDCITWLFTEGGCFLAPLMTKLRSHFSTRRLLLLILLYTLIFSIWSGENIWTVVAATIQPYLKLQHLKLPPI